MLRTDLNIIKAKKYIVVYKVVDGLEKLEVYGIESVQDFYTQLERNYGYDMVSLYNRRDIITDVKCYDDLNAAYKKIDENMVEEVVAESVVTEGVVTEGE